MELVCDVLVVGAGCGGIAAAMAAADLGEHVVLTEPSDWLGGQLTAQAVPPDEHPWIETTGCTASYRRLREAVRDRYRADPRLCDAARHDPALNPGGGWVSQLCAEPSIIHRVLDDVSTPHQQAGRLDVRQHYHPVTADVAGDRVTAVAFDSSAGEPALLVHAAYVLDATEEGDLLPLTDCETVLGAESATDTGEPHALPGAADPFDQQAITWCAALEWRPGRQHITDPPASYQFWRSYRAPFWPGPQLGWTTQDPETGKPRQRPLFSTESRDLWHFRRIRNGDLYQPPLPDITLINWPQVDYWLGPVTGVPASTRDQHLTAARELTLSFIHWMQTEAPRHDGGFGYPELAPSGTPLGTTDGLAAQPYVRESRRIKAEFTILEQHVGVHARPGATHAEPFPDTVGIGSYRIDLHPSTAGRGYIDIPSYPFQIPLGALLPVRLDNLLPAAKNLGATHVTGGCYRLHPVEWNVGEAAGILAAYAHTHRLPPRAVRAKPQHRADYQNLLTQRGIPLQWPDHIRSQVR